MDVEVRPANAGDLPALSALAKRSWFDAFGHSVSPEEAEAELEATRSEEYFGDALTRDSILIAEVNGRLLGYVQFGDVSIEEAEARPGDQELHRLYVETAEHGRGVGRALVDAALHHPRLAGASRIYLQVWERNDRAVRMYRRAGFRTVGRTRFTIGAGEVVEDLVMLLDQDTAH